MSLGRVETNYCFVSTLRRAPGCRRRRAPPARPACCTATSSRPFRRTSSCSASTRCRGGACSWRRRSRACRARRSPPPHLHQRRDQPSLGRNLATGANGIAAVPLIAPGTMYDERLYQLDFRASKIVRIGRARLQANVDLYNAANASSILTINTDLRIELAETHQHPPGPPAEVRRTMGLLALLLRSDRAGSKRRRVTKTRRSRRSRTKPTGFFVSFVPSR